MNMNLCLLASILLLLLGASSPAFAGDGDVNYSAPYITVDPETGELVTVNPGPELKTHPGTGSGTSAGIDGGTAEDGAGAAENQAAQASDHGSGSALLLFAVLGALGVLSALLFVARGRARITDA